MDLELVFLKNGLHKREKQILCKIDLIRFVTIFLDKFRYFVIFDVFNLLFADIIEALVDFFEFGAEKPRFDVLGALKPKIIFEWLI